MGFLKNISRSTSSDADLIELYKRQQDIKILADLYQRYMDLCFAVCLKYLKDAELSKDAVMDVFEALPQKVMKHEIQNFRSWIYVLVKNHCLMKLRSSGSKRFEPLDGAFMQNGEMLHPEEEDREWQIERLTNCIDKLSGPQKQSVSLFFLENRSYKEIAELTGLEWNRVRSLIQNGKRNLKICMEQKENRIAT